ncbi:MAG: ribonuclease P protein component [Gammaproteobacteria bacterium]|nr:ribonuclease P protein component [Gammaproteobacteria bacterium]
MNLQPGTGYPPDVRLHNSKEFNIVFEQATHRESGPEFLMLGRINNLNYNRLGMIVTKRILPAAVRRNAIKRLIRESFRHMAINSNPLDIVVLARSGVSRMNRQELRYTLDKMFLKLATSKIISNPARTRGKTQVQSPGQCL